MTGIDVDLNALSTIATGLDTAVTKLEDLAASVPSGIDAGPMTAVVASMISQVVDSAGNVSTALSGSAEAVHSARSSYERTDADTNADLEQIRKVMQP